MIHQILQALILTKVTGMNLSVVFPILMDSILVILYLLTIMWNKCDSSVLSRLDAKNAQKPT